MPNTLSTQELAEMLKFTNEALGLMSDQDLDKIMSGKRKGNADDLSSSLFNRLSAANPKKREHVIGGKSDLSKKINTWWLEKNASLQDTSS